MRNVRTASGRTSESRNLLRNLYEATPKRKHRIRTLRDMAQTAWIQIHAHPKWKWTPGTNSNDRGNEKKTHGSITRSTGLHDPPEAKVSPLYRAQEKQDQKRQLRVLCTLYRLNRSSPGTRALDRATEWTRQYRGVLRILKQRSHRNS